MARTTISHRNNNLRLFYVSGVIDMKQKKSTVLARNEKEAVTKAWPGFDWNSCMTRTKKSIRHGDHEHVLFNGYFGWAKVYQA